MGVSLFLITILIAKVPYEGVVQGSCGKDWVQVTMQLGACEKSTVATCSSSNVHGGNMHLCNVHSGNVQQSACTACNVQVGCMRHLHCTALDSCNDCSAISLHSGHVTTCIDRSRQKRRHCTRCAAAYLRPRSQMCNLLQSSTEAIIFGQKLTC